MGNESRLDGVATVMRTVARAVSRVVSNPPLHRIRRHRVQMVVVERTFLERPATKTVLLADVVRVRCKCDVGPSVSSAHGRSRRSSWRHIGTAGKLQTTVFGRADVKADAPHQRKVKARQAQPNQSWENQLILRQPVPSPRTEAVVPRTGIRSAATGRKGNAALFTGYALERWKCGW